VEGHVASIRRRVVDVEFWWSSMIEGDHLKDPEVDGREILKWILKTSDG
jgi:hypothetical protein